MFGDVLSGWDVLEVLEDIESQGEKDSVGPKKLVVIGDSGEL